MTPRDRAGPAFSPDDEWEGWSIEVFTMDVDNDMNAGLSLAEGSADSSVGRCSAGECSTAERPNQPCTDPQCPYQLEARLWFQARKNLMLLYNGGGRPAPEHA